MPNLRLGVPEHGVRSEDFGDCGHFRSAQSCNPEAAYLQVWDVSDRDVGFLAASANHFLAGRFRITSGSPARTYNRVHTVAVSLGVLSTFQHECHSAVARYHPRQVFTERG